MIAYSLIVPVYNESKILEKTILTVNDYLKEKKKTYELIIADDGSVDNSREIVQRLQKKYPELVLVGNQNNEGKGSVLTKACAIAQGNIIAYIDADLAIDYHLFEIVVKLFNEGYDVIICSKHLPDSIVEYPKLRRVASKCYSYLVRLLFGINIKDYQCGFKAFKKEVIKDIVRDVKNKGWTWDTEVLVKSHVKGYRIKEIPAKVVNIYERESTVHLLKDSYVMAKNVVQLFFELRGK